MGVSVNAGKAWERDWTSHSRQYILVLLLQERGNFFSIRLSPV